MSTGEIISSVRIINNSSTDLPFILYHSLCAIPVIVASREHETNHGTHFNYLDLFPLNIMTIFTFLLNTFWNTSVCNAGLLYNCIMVLSILQSHHILKWCNFGFSIVFQNTISYLAQMAQLSNREEELAAAFVTAHSQNITI